jgi:hypothetical protein
VISMDRCARPSHERRIRRSTNSPTVSLLTTLAASTAHATPELLIGSRRLGFPSVLALGSARVGGGIRWDPVKLRGPSIWAEDLGKLGNSSPEFFFAAAPWAEGLCGCNLGEHPSIELAFTSASSVASRC